MLTVMWSYKTIKMMKFVRLFVVLILSSFFNLILIHFCFSLFLCLSLSLSLSSSFLFFSFFFSLYFFLLFFLSQCNKCLFTLVTSALYKLHMINFIFICYVTFHFIKLFQGLSFYFALMINYSAGRDELSLTIS